MHADTIKKIVGMKSQLEGADGKIFFVYIPEAEFKVPAGSTGTMPLIWFSKTEISLTNYAAMLKKEVKDLKAGTPSQIVIGKAKLKEDQGAKEWILKYYYSKREVALKDQSHLTKWGSGPIPFLKNAKFQKSPKTETAADGTTKLDLNKKNTLVDYDAAVAAKQAWVNGGKAAKANFETMKKKILADADVKASPELMRAAKALSVARVEFYTKGLDAAFAALEAEAPKKKGDSPKNPISYVAAVKNFRKALTGLIEKFEKDLAFKAIDDSKENPFGSEKIAEQVKEGLAKLSVAYLKVVPKAGPAPAV